MQHYLSMRIEFWQKLLYLKDRSSRGNILNDRVRKDLGSKQETEMSSNQIFKFIKENVTCHITAEKRKKMKSSLLELPVRKLPVMFEREVQVEACHKARGWQCSGMQTYPSKSVPKESHKS